MSNERIPHPKSISAGDHLELMKVGEWEYVRRTRGTGVVGVVGVTSNHEVLLVEQFRPPVSASVIELPAGLVADEESESVLEAARRELLEETGYTGPSNRFTWIMSAPSSAGLTDESVQVVVGRDLARTQSGGGIGSERITVHCIPIDQLDNWIQQKARSGALIDFKVRLVPHFLAEVPQP